MKRIVGTLWLLGLGAAGAYLIFLRWHWLSGHGENVLAVLVVLGLLGAVFPLAAWLASGKKFESENERLKLQNDIRTTIFQAIAGLAVLVGVFVAWRQLQSDRAASQATNMLATQEQVAQAYSQAVSELSSHREDVRIGGMYALEEIFRAGQRPDKAPTNPIIIRIRPAVFGLLTAYIPIHAPWRAASPVCDRSASKMPALSDRAPDIQEALNVLAFRGYGAPGEPGLFVEYANLRKADLYGSFDDTDFSHSDLAGVNFHNASLAGTVFADTDLCGAHLTGAVHYKNDNFKGAVADAATKFPKGFKPSDYGIIVKH
jgi:hypothetical protein